jgi:hypothetical protein
MAYLRTIDGIQSTQIDEYILNIDLDNSSYGQVAPVTLADFFNPNEQTGAVAADTLQASIIGSELENDTQTILLKQLLTVSINYSSKPVVERIQILGKMLEIRTQLLREIKNDRQKYIDMDNAFKIATEHLVLS